MVRITSAFVLPLLLLVSSVLGAQAAEQDKMQLVMFEQKACEWCEVWNEQIGPIYPKTPEGKRAPLRRVDIHDPHPADLSEIRTSRFTPTFVLVSKGQELGRINGYPGEDFFWGLLGRMLKNHDRHNGKAN